MATQQPQNLGLGSSGSDVSELQQNLKYHHVYKGPIDGVYGPQTQAAVRNFQQMSGIKTDGIYGPQTTSTLENWMNNPVKFAAADPIIQQRMQQNPQFAQTVNAAVQNGGNQGAMLETARVLAAGGNTGFIDSNGQLNNDLFQQSALAQASPQINQMLKYYNSDFQNSLQHEQTQYQNQLGQIGRQFPVDKMNLETQMGQNGNWDSSYGNLQRNNLVANTNQKISDLQNNTQYSLSNTARQFENQLGTNQANQYNYNLGSGNVGSFGGGYQSGGNFNAYTPLGNQGGSLLAGYASQINSSANNMQSGSIPQVPKYNQYLGASVYGGQPSQYPYPNY